MSMPVDVSELRKEGYVLKESAIIRHYRKRWLVLTRTHLYTFKKDRSYAEPTEVVELKACGTVKSADDITNKAFSFTVQVPERNFYFACANEKERNEWVAAIGRATTESRRVRSYSEEIEYQEEQKRQLQYQQHVQQQQMQAQAQQQAAYATQAQAQAGVGPYGGAAGLGQQPAYGGAAHFAGGGLTSGGLAAQLAGGLHGLGLGTPAAPAPAQWGQQPQQTQPAAWSQPPTQPAPQPPVSYPALSSLPAFPLPTASAALQPQPQADHSALVAPSHPPPQPPQPSPQPALNPGLQGLAGLPPLKGIPTLASQQ